jgi:Zn-dependent peptidase ImmA (M78 family)
MDDKAFEFACHLLIPKSQLENAFRGRSAVQLVQYKERFGISMAAMIYRAQKIKILDDRTTKRLWIQFARNGWRAKEPGRVRADRAFRFETLIDVAFSEKFITTWSEAAEITGVSAAELRRRRNLAMGIPNEEEGGVTFRIRE